MAKNRRIQVIGRDREELDIDLLVRAVLAVAERRAREAERDQPAAAEASA